MSTDNVPAQPSQIRGPYYTKVPAGLQAAYNTCCGEGWECSIPNLHVLIEAVVMASARGYNAEHVSSLTGCPLIMTQAIRRRCRKRIANVTKEYADIKAIYEAALQHYADNEAIDVNHFGYQLLTEYITSPDHK